MPRWAGSIGALIGAYAAVMIAAALWLPHEWDWAVFGWLSSSARPVFSDQVKLIDIRWDPADVAGNRRRIGSFLDALVASGQRPNAVILDVEFDACPSTPCGQPMDAERLSFADSIRLADRMFPVYATEEPPTDREDEVSGPVSRQDPDIYGALTGAAQTRFTTVGSGNGLFYRACYSGVPFEDATGAPQGTIDVWSMVDRVLMPAGFVAGAACDPAHVAVRVGPNVVPAPPMAYAYDGAPALPDGAQFDQAYLIVGTLAYDRSPYSDRSGPELLGWALSNALDRASPVGARTYFETQPQNGMLALLVPGFSGLAVVAFTALFFLLKRSRLRELRPALPWLSAAGAAAFGLVLFAAFEAWLLHAHQIQPQVTLISLGIVTASGLAGVRGSRILDDEAHALDAAPVETYDYDVFVSYAREEGAWVFEHVYAPLRDARLPNGKNLSVFFDSSSIRSGTGWQTTLAAAIDGSRFIVPVYSDIYFEKPYCRYEILRAHRKWVLAGPESRCVLPVMRGHPKILATVDDIQARSIDDDPGLVRQIVAEICVRLTRDAAANEPEQQGVGS